jgi:hypothetical protein
MHLERDVVDLPAHLDRDPLRLQPRYDADRLLERLRLHPHYMHGHRHPVRQHRGFGSLQRRRVHAHDDKHLHGDDHAVRAAQRSHVQRHQSAWVHMVRRSDHLHRDGHAVQSAQRGDVLASRRLRVAVTVAASTPVALPAGARLGDTHRDPYRPSS